MQQENVWEVNTPWQNQHLTNAIVSSPRATQCLLSGNLCVKELTLINFYFTSHSILLSIHHGYMATSLSINYENGIDDKTVL